MCLAKKNVEKTFIKENAGNPIPKYNNAFAEFLTLSWSNDPYPNKEDIISSEAIDSAIAAGMLKNKLNSKALFWIRFIFSFLLFWTYLESWGSITVPIAIPAIARLIW